MSDFPSIKIYPPGLYVEIDGDTLFLGRDCHLASLIPTLLNKVVSNRHCVIRREGARWMLEDLGSTNGTWIRGARLAGKTLLHTNDEFRLGQKGPLIVCLIGFGGTGPERTIPEDELPADAASTMVESPAAAKTEVMPRAEPPRRAAAPPPPNVTAGSPDGTVERPFKVGKTPGVMLRHLRTGEEFTASGYTVVLGRDPAAAQIVIRTDEEKHVSGQHAEIQFRSDHTVVVRDLGSRNGTWLNDKPVKSEMRIKVGDRLLLGNAPTVLVVAELDA
jgi:pSer/pThr/pTyr-binding forkhead associated (FHA) protein